MEDTLEVTTIVNETPSELDEVKHVVEEVAAAAAKVAEEAAAAKAAEELAAKAAEELAAKVAEELAAKVAEEAAAAKTTQLAEELEKIKITPNSIFKRLKSFFGVNS